MIPGPYRSDPTGPRYVCLVCYARASPVRGLCPTCEVELLALEDAEVRAELRAEAERRMQRRQYGEYFGLSLFGYAIAVPLLPFVGAFAYLAIGLVGSVVASGVYTKLRPGSALALYRARRRRLALELSGRAASPPALPAHRPTSVEQERVDGADPEELPIEQTLRWLGVRIDGPR